MAVVQVDLPDTSTEGDLETQQPSPQPDKQDGDQQVDKALVQVQVDLPSTSTDGGLESQQHQTQAGGEHEGVPEVSAQHTGGPAEAERSVALRWYHVLLLISLSVLAPFSTDAYVPSMEKMSQEFGNSTLLVMLSLPVNMIVSGLSTPALGHLSDRVGRRPVLLACVAVQILGNVLCAVAPTVQMLLLARAIQGIGAGSGPLPTAVVQDATPDRDEFMRISSCFGALRPAANVVAPLVGGLLASSTGGWRSVFWLTAGWASVNLVLTFVLLPETLARRQPDMCGGGQEEEPGRADEADGAAENEQHAAAASPSEPQRKASNVAVPGWKSKLRRLFCDRLVTGSLLSFTVLFSAIILMLMQLPLVLPGDYQKDQSATSVLIASVSCSMFVPPILVWLLSFKSVSQLAFLRVGFGFGMVVAAVACAVTPVADDHFWLFMALMYGLVMTESTVAPAINTVFLLTLQDMSGLACSVQDGFRNLVSAGIAVAFAVTAQSSADAHVPAAGLLLGVAVLLGSSSAIFWASFGLWPPQVLLQAAKPCPELAGAELA